MVIAFKPFVFLFTVSDETPNRTCSKIINLPPAVISKGFGTAPISWDLRHSHGAALDQALILSSSQRGHDGHVLRLNPGTNPRNGELFPKYPSKIQACESLGLSFPSAHAKL